MSAKEVVAEHKNNMEKAVEYLHNEMRGVRTGRASSGLVESLRVDYYGSQTPLNQLANIAVPEPAMIVIKPFDPSCLKEIEKAIKSSDLSLAPMADGKVIRLNIPPLSEERRKQIAGQIKQMGEKAKVSIRNIRRDGNKHLEDEEKAKIISEDERDKGKKDIDEVTKQSIDKVDKAAKVKAEEIMSD
ncbi:MAG TPA: ribosome recycling factor [Phycisphaerales bacterium]|nr:ribosome recycling factor [Phycisphaerales bacterium]